MALNNFIAEIWSDQVLESLQKNLVYGQSTVINRNYEGDIKGKGDTVRITAFSPITVGDYDAASGLSDPETLDDASTTLTMDNDKYFNFMVDDADKAQASVNLMKSATSDAGYQLADAADVIIASLYTDADLANLVGDDTAGIVPNTTAGTTALDYIADLKQALDESNVPLNGRWLVIPPWYLNRLIKQEAIRSDADSGSTEGLRNGWCGRLYGFDVLVSNNVQTKAGSGDDAGKTNYKIMAGYPGTITFADSVNDVEAIRPDKFFADAVRGRHVYGAKVVRTSALAVLTARAVTGE